jgi:hypothetical protein
MAKSEHCSSRNIRAHWKCEQGGCDCRCHETVIYSSEGGTILQKRTIRHTRKLSPRGNWLVVTYHEGEIHFATWVQTWAGVQASKRNAEKSIAEYAKTYKGFSGRVLIVDIERMIDFAVTEGANEMADLERLISLEDNRE